MSDKVNPFSIVAPITEPEVVAVAEESSTPVPEEQELDIKTPIERMIQRELKSDKFVLAFYDAAGDLGFYTGDDIDPQEISFLTDVIKARVMMQLLLDD